MMKIDKYEYPKPEIIKNGNVFQVVLKIDNDRIRDEAIKRIVEMAEQLADEYGTSPEEIIRIASEMYD